MQGVQEMNCPVCGLPSPTTSVVCPTHIVIVYGSNGEIISYTDIVVKKP